MVAVSGVALPPLVGSCSPPQKIPAWQFPLALTIIPHVDPTNPRAASGAPPMKVAIAADHAGYALKQELVPALRALGHEVQDLGTHGTDPVDYPDVAEALSRVVLSGAAERGVLICGSGVGACVAANKVPGIRAAICHDTYSAHQGVEHDDMNILVLGARVIGTALAGDLARVFLEARYTHEERHERRLRKVEALEGEFRRRAT
jgi:ribose 5-phosphate isomerase B